jgi:hypothetical protein
MESDSNKPRHYTKQPLWIIPLAGLVILLIALARFGDVLRLASDSNMHPAFAFLSLAGLGMAAAIPLVLASWVKNRFLSGLMLWGGIFVVAILICIGLLWLN